MTTFERFFTSKGPVVNIAPSTIGAPGMIMHVNREVFKQSPLDRKLAKAYKSRYKHGTLSKLS